MDQYNEPMNFVARHNTTSHTVGIHAETCNARKGAKGISWTVEALDATAARLIVIEDEGTEDRGIKVTICGCCK